jgi:hypothetical protein
MFTLLGLLPRWFLVGGLTFLFGFSLGQVTAYRRLALEASVTRQERLHRADPSPSAVGPRIAAARGR